MKQTKRLISLLLTIAMAVTMLGAMSITVSAFETTDIVLGDFTAVDSTKAYDVSKWKKISGNWSAGELQSEITRAESSMALKWDNFGDGINASDSRLQTQTTKEIFNYFICEEGETKYMNMWIYSDVANNQTLNTYMHNSETGVNVWKPDKTDLATKFNIDWSGWKLVSIPFSKQLSDFDNADTPKAATTNDKGYFQLQGSGFGVKPLADTVLYVDSIWISETDPRAIDANTPEIAFSKENNAIDVPYAEKDYYFTANKEFALGKNALDSYVEVKLNGKALRAGADYTIQQEFNKLYVRLTDNLADGGKYTFTLKAGAPFSDGTALSANAAYSFTAAKNTYMIGNFSVKDAHKNWAYFNQQQIQTNEVTMAGKDLSLKWSDHKYQPGTTQSDSGNRWSSKLETPGQTDIKIGKVLDYDNIGAWIYSDVANGQIVNVMLTNATTAKNYEMNFAVDWTGWKKVALDITGAEVASFDNSKNEGTDKPVKATENDTWKILFQTSGWSVTPLEDTLLYVDSVFLFNDTEEKKAERFANYSNSGSKDKITGQGTTVYGTENGNSYGSGTASAVIDLAKVESGKNTSSMIAAKSRTFNAEERANKYINLVIKPSKETTQQFRVAVVGMVTDTAGGTGKEMRYYKDGLGFTGTDWQIVTVKISDLKIQNADRIWADDTIINTVNMYFPSWTYDATKIDTELDVYVDSVWISDYDMSAAAAVTPVATLTNGEAISSVTDSVGFEFPIDLKTTKGEYANKVTVTCNEETVPATDYTVQSEGNMLYVKFDKGLTPENDYEVSLAAITSGDYLTSEATSVSFSTLPAHFDVEYTFGASALPEKGDPCEVTALFTNATSEATTARLIMAYYDGDDVLVQATVSDAVEIPAGKSVEIPGTITSSDDYTSVKCYVWEFDSLKAYTSEIGVLPR